MRMKYVEKEMYKYINNYKKINSKLLNISLNNEVEFFDQQSFQCDHLKNM